MSLRLMLFSRSRCAAADVFSRSRCAAALLAVSGALAACQAPPPRFSGGGGGGAGQGDAAAAASCRQQAEDVYNAQNRSARIQVDTRDTPFSGAYTPNMTSRGLSDRYAMDAMIGDCMRNASRREAGPDLSATPASAQPGAQAPARAANRLSAGPAGGPPAATVTGTASGVPLERAPPPPPPVRP